MDLMLESLPRLLNATILTIELTLLSLFFGIFVFLGGVPRKNLTTIVVRISVRRVLSARTWIPRQAQLSECDV